MRYGQIRKYDVANGEGVRTSLFVTGCTHNCFNCFNTEYQDFNSGEVWTSAETNKIIDYLQDSHVNGLSILGGEPMQNVPKLTSIIKEIKKTTDKNIWIWSGYTYEEIIKDNNKLELLRLCDILVDGKFVQKLKDLTLKFKGSSNQRIIDVQKSLKENKVILYNN
ncbi:anaerobic ribonucleoside-triphosphate reductase activating protein [Tissierella praeacuta]|uniref:anaerobic ribonucleoside-triphosphate reductase activating protein n=1 Tax=Tissierella praeacuta TaxID=43131 RepID=UPI003DA561A3